MGRLSGRPIKTAAAASAPGPGYKSFAIWGAGQMGKPIIEGLLALRKSQPDIIVTVLTRPVSLIVFNSIQPITHLNTGVRRQ
jgi:hypothetical protein